MIIRRPVRRETATVYRGRALMVELHPGYVVLREKGRRTSVTVDWRTVYETGWKILARAAAAERGPRKRRR